MQTHVLSASTLQGTSVKNPEGEDLGKIEDLTIDLDKGNIGYAVLSFGGFLGMGDKLFAVPWRALQVDTDNECIRLNTSKEQLKKAPGFDKNHWPDFADAKFRKTHYTHYGVPQ